MSKSIKLQNDTYLDSCSIVHNEKQLSEILNNLVTYDTITDLSLKAGDTYQLNLKPNILFVEVLLSSNGTNYSGGNFVVINQVYNYLTNTSIHTNDYNGIYVTINYNGLVSISSYRHCGADVTGFRIWYLNL